MLSDHRSSGRRMLGWCRALVVLAAAGMAAAACGSADPSPDAEVSIGAPAPLDEDGPQYGDSLDEWVEAGGSGDEAGDGPDTDSEVVNDYPDGFELVGWEDLIPPGQTGDEVFARYEARLAELEDGSPEAEAIYAEMQAEYETNAGVNQGLDGAKVNLAGFVAPLTWDGDVITEFLLVPYFGACIHVPPPPPNQTVLVKLDKANGLSFDESWGAVWVAGTLTLDRAWTDLATASYTMTGAASGVYDEYA